MSVFSIVYFILLIIFSIVALCCVPLLIAIVIGLLIHLYNIPFYIYCYFKLSPEDYNIVSNINFIKRSSLATKCYFYLLTFRKPKFKLE